MQKKTLGMKGRWVAISAVTGVLCALSVAVAAGLRTNWTESMPRGLWRSEPFDGTVHRGDTVAVCLPHNDLTRRYIGTGSCSNGLEPVLKTIGAIVGDTIEMTAYGARVNDILLENTAPLVQDSLGKTLTAWPYGLYHVHEDEVWLLSSYNARSFDSRYFGPVLVSRIIARGVPVLVWR